MAEEIKPNAPEGDMKTPDLASLLNEKFGVKNTSELLDPKAYDPEKVKNVIFERAADVLRDDSEFRQNIAEEGVQQTRAKLVEAVSSQFNVKAEDISDKSIDEILSYARDRVSQNSDSRVKELDEEVARLKREIKHRDEVTIPAVEQKANERYRELVKQTMIEDSMEGLDLIVSKSFARSGLMEHLQTKYRVEADPENRILKITNKAGEAVRGPDTQKLSVKDIIKMEADALGILSKQKQPQKDLHIPANPGQKEQQGGAGQNNWANPNGNTSRAAARENLQRQLQKIGYSN